jgi:hypothetical protein
MGAGSGPAAVWPLLSDPAQSLVIRSRVFKQLRVPGTPGITTNDDMPRLLGDDPYNDRKTMRLGLSLTVTQYAILQKWLAGGFVASALPPASLLQPPIPAAVTPHGLDRAALEHASGGAFFPGIEVGWQIREPAIFAEPFRIRAGATSRYVGDRPGTTITAGYFSRQMALPWIADFLQCSHEMQTRATPPTSWGWWPSQRPDEVYPNPAEAAKQGTMLPWDRATIGPSPDWPADAEGPAGRPPTMPSFRQMIANWWKFGVVVYTPGKGFAESDRSASVP